MCRSSKILCLATIFFELTAGAVAAQTRSGGLRATPRADFAIQPRVVGPRVDSGDALRPQAGLVPNGVGRPGFERRVRFRHRGFGGYGFAGDGIGLAIGAGLAPGYGPDAYDEAYDQPGADAPASAFAPPPPCIRPQIIRIGRPTRHPGTRVVYGAPPCGS